MPDFDVFSHLEFWKPKSRSHVKRQKGIDKRKKCCQTSTCNTSLNDLSTRLREHGRHAILSFLSFLPIRVLCILDIEAYRFNDRNQQMYEAALLTGRDAQHTLHQLIDSEIDHKIHFIKIHK